MKTYNIAVLAGDGIGPEVMAEALKVLDREKVDLLIIDVMMPKLDGIRATL